jgi:secondary thiamine-phosphate synthase enzyme
MIEKIELQVNGQGLYSFTDKVADRVKLSSVDEGLCNLFIQHTSASLLIQENYDPTAQQDLENWLNRLVPENDSLYKHTLEGPDDSPAHIKAALTAVCLSVPIQHGKLMLGSWQGIYLWEHRHYTGKRSVVVHLA